MHESDSMVKIQGQGEDQNDALQAMLSKNIKVPFNARGLEQSPKQGQNLERIEKSNTGNIPNRKNFNTGPNPGTMTAVRRGNDPEEQKWAEVAKFNQLLDKKIKLDEASEFRRKANLQKMFLDS